jgi:hypothetical protein
MEYKQTVPNRRARESDVLYPVVRCSVQSSCHSFISITR